MIIGIGNDICNETRIENAFERYGTRFINRILTASEIEEMAKDHPRSIILLNILLQKKQFTKRLRMRYHRRHLA